MLVTTDRQSFINSFHPITNEGFAAIENRLQTSSFKKGDQTKYNCSAVTDSEIQYLTFDDLQSLYNSFRNIASYLGIDATNFSKLFNKLKI